MIIDSKNYCIDNFINTLEIKGGRKQHLDYVLSNFVKSSNIFLEFGVWKGTTINIIAEKFPNVEIHGFDSFEGLPEKWFLTKKELETNNPKHTTKTFSLKKLPKVRKNVILHKGYFDKILPKWLSNCHTNMSISFLHIDSDLYSSAKYILSLLNKHIKKDTIILFDDFYKWDNPNVYELWSDGEYKALEEWMIEYNRKIEILCRSETGFQTTVKVINEF